MNSTSFFSFTPTSQTVQSCPLSNHYSRPVKQAAPARQDHIQAKLKREHSASAPRQVCVKRTSFFPLFHTDNKPARRPSLDHYPTIIPVQSSELPQLEETTYELSYNAGTALALRGRCNEALPPLRRAEQACCESVIDDGGTDEEAREEAAIIRSVPIA